MHKIPGYKQFNKAQVAKYDSSINLLQNSIQKLRKESDIKIPKKKSKFISDYIDGINFDKIDFKDIRLLSEIIKNVDTILKLFPTTVSESKSRKQLKNKLTKFKDEIENKIQLLYKKKLYDDSKKIFFSKQKSLNPQQSTELQDKSDTNTDFLPDLEHKESAELQDKNVTYFDFLSEENFNRLFNKEISDNNFSTINENLNELIDVFFQLNKLYLSNLPFELETSQQDFLELPEFIKEMKSNQFSLQNMQALGETSENLVPNIGVMKELIAVLENKDLDSQIKKLNELEIHPKFKESKFIEKIYLLLKSNILQILNEKSSKEHLLSNKKEALIKSQQVFNFQRLKQLEQNNPWLIGTRISAIKYDHESEFESLQKKYITPDKVSIKIENIKEKLEELDSDKLDSDQVLIICNYDRKLANECFEIKDRTVYKECKPKQEKIKKIETLREKFEFTKGDETLHKILQFMPFFSKDGNTFTFENIDNIPTKDENSYFDIVNNTDLSSENDENMKAENFDSFDRYGTNISNCKLLKRLFPYEFNDIQSKLQEFIKEIVNNKISDFTQIEEYIDNLHNKITDSFKEIKTYHEKPLDKNTQKDIATLILYEESLNTNINFKSSQMKSNKELNEQLKNLLDNELENKEKKSNLLLERFNSKSCKSIFLTAFKRLDKTKWVQFLNYESTSYTTPRPVERLSFADQNKDIENQLYDLGQNIKDFENCKKTRQQLLLKPEETSLENQIIPRKKEDTFLKPAIALSKEATKGLGAFMTHMFLDPDMKESTLEGGTPRVMMYTLSEFLELELKNITDTDKSLTEETKDQLTTLNNAISKGLTFVTHVEEFNTKKNIINTEKEDTQKEAIKDKAKNDITKMIKGLHSSKYILIPFGHNAYPAGHATYLKLFKNENSNYTVQHYNLGDGCDVNQTTKFNSKKNKFLRFPFSKVENIKEEDLTNDLFLQALYDTNFSKSFDVRKKLSMNYAHSTLQLLGPLSKIDNPDPNDFQEEQHSGICSFHSLRALIKNTLASDEYTVFEAKLGINSIHAFYNYCHKEQQFLNLPNLTTLKACIQRCIETLTPHLKSLEKINIDQEIKELNVLLTHVNERIEFLTSQDIQTCKPLEPKINYKTTINLHPSVVLTDIQPYTKKPIEFKEITTENVNKFLKEIVSTTKGILDTKQGYNHAIVILNSSLLHLPTSNPDITSKINVDDLLELSQLLMTCWTKANVANFSHSTQKDSILCNAKVLLLTLKKIREKFSNNKTIDPTKHDITSEEALKNFFVTLDLDIETDLNTIFSASKATGSMNLFDHEQYQLLEELKALARDINSKKTQRSNGIEEHNLSSYKKIKIRDDQKHAQQAIATLVHKCCKVDLDKDAITSKLVSPSSDTERGKLIDNCDKSLPEEYRQFINAASYFYLSLNSSGVRSEEDKGLIFGQDFQGIGVTNSTSYFGDKLISIGSVAVHPSQLTDVVLQNMIDRKQYSKIGEGLNNQAEKLKFDTDVNFKKSNISSDLKDDLLKLMSFNSKEDDMDHGLYLTQLLNFFNTRSDLLIKGPQAKEFKEFFKQLLFTEALNKTTLEKYNGIKPSIITFLDKYYHEMIRQNNFANALYFLKLMILIESRIDNDFNCIAKINNLLETLTKSNDNEKLKILHQFRLAHFYQRKKPINEFEQNYLTSLYTCSSLTSDNENFDSDIEGLCEKARIFFADPLVKWINKNPQKLTEIVIQDKETPKMGWAQFKGSDMFKSNSGLYTFECFSGKLLTDNKQTQIPEKLKFNDTFNDMFSKEEQRKMSFEEVTDNTYKFDLPNNMKLTLFSTKKGFDFELEKEGLSFKLSTNNVDLKIPNSLKEKNYIFIEKDNRSENQKKEFKVIFVDKVSKKWTYQARVLKKGYFNDLIDIYDRQNRQLKKINSSTIECFNEDLDTIEYLETDSSKDGQSKNFSALLNFSALELSFECKNKAEKKFFCNSPELSDFWIDEAQYCRAIEGLIGGIRITNGKNAKYIFPSRKISVLKSTSLVEKERVTTDEKDQVLTNRFEFKKEKEEKLSSILPKFFILNEDELEVDTVTEKPHTNRMNDLFLLYSLCATENYEDAFKLISQRLLEIKEFSDQECELVIRIFGSLSTKRACQNAIYLKLVAKIINLYNLKHNKIQEKKSTPEYKNDLLIKLFKQIDGMNLIYSDYLKLIHSTQGLCLSTEEEKIICHYLNHFYPFELDNTIKKRFDYFAISFNEIPKKARIKNDLVLNEDYYIQKTISSVFDVRNHYKHIKALGSKGKDKAKKWIDLIRKVRPNEPLAMLLEIYYEEDVDLDKDNLSTKTNKVITEAIKKHYLYNTEFKKHKEALRDESKPDHKKAMTWFKRLKEYFPTSDQVKIVEVWQNLKIDLYDEFEDKINSNKDFSERVMYYVNEDTQYLKENPDVAAIIKPNSYQEEVFPESKKEISQQTRTTSLDEVEDAKNPGKHTRQFKIKPNNLNLALPKSLVQSMFADTISLFPQDSKKNEEERAETELSSNSQDALQIKCDKEMAALNKDEKTFKNNTQKKEGAIRHFLNELQPKNFSFEKKTNYFITLKNQYRKLKRQYEKEIRELSKTNFLKHMGSNTTISMNDLIFAYLKQSQDAYNKLNSQLSFDQCEALNQMIFEYLLISKYINKINRVQQLSLECHTLIDDHGLNDIFKLENQVNALPLNVIAIDKKIEDLTQKKQVPLKNLKSKLIDLYDECQIEEGTGAQLKLNTFYKPEKYPELLIFEAKTRMSLRKNQINKLLEMYAEPLSEKPMENIHQMIMGFGKTKVLLPILAFKKADGHNLSTIIVPEVLLDDVVVDLNKKSSEIFGQTPFIFNFDRDSSLLEGDLNLLKLNLENAITKQNPVVTTSKAIHCLRLKLIEKMWMYIDKKADFCKTYPEPKKINTFLSEFEELHNNQLESNKEYKYYVTEYLDNPDFSKLSKLEQLISQMLQDKEGLNSLILTLTKTNNVMKKMTQEEIEEKLNEFSDEDKNKISTMIFEKANENNLSIEETKQLIIESNKAESAVPKKGLNEEFFQNFLRQIGIKRVFNFIKNSQKESQPIAQLQAIITLFKDKAATIIDEADTILNCKNEVNFTLGANLFPEGNQLRFLVTLHSKLKDIPELESKKEYILEKLKKDSSFLGTEIKNAISKLGFKKIETFLDAKSASDTLQEDDLKLIENEKSILYLLKEELNELLDITYSRKISENYGPDLNEEKYYALPYTALNYQSLTSRFDQIHEVLNYTIQMYLKKSEISQWIIKKHLQKLYSEFQLEEKKGISFEDSETKRKLQKFFPSLDNIKQIQNNEEIDNLSKEIFEKFKSPVNSHYLNNYLIEHILPKISTNDTTLNSNSFDIVDMFKHIQGFTGTPWNKDTYHRRLDCEPAEATDGESLHNLRNLAPHLIENSETFKDVIKRIDLTPPRQALIDCGGLMVGGTNKEIAESLLRHIKQDKNPKIKSIVFYHEGKQTLGFVDDTSDKFEIKPYKAEDINPEERFTFYDQEHTTGSDISQTENACAIVTVSENVIQQKLFQSIWRMRGLSKSQSVDIYYNNKLQEIFKKKKIENPTIEDIITHVTQKQASQVLSQTIQTSEAQFNHIQRNFNFEQCLNTPSYKLSQELIEPFITRKSIDPEKMYKGNKAKVKTEDLRSSWESKLDEWMKNQQDSDRIKVLKAQKNEAIDVVKERLPYNEVEAPIKKHDETAEVQQENLIQQEIKKETHIETYRFLRYPERVEFDTFQTFIQNENGTAYKEITDGKGLFSIETTVNLERLVNQNSSTNTFDSKFKLDCDYVLALSFKENDEEKKKVIMLHGYDLEHLVKLASESNSTKLSDLKYSFLGISHTKDTPNIARCKPESDVSWLDEDFQKKIIEVKLFNNQIYLSRAESKLFCKDMTGEKKQQWIEFIQQYSLKKNEIDLESFKETQLGKALTSFSDE